MRYLSRIIKSSKVSFVSNTGIDNPVVVKTDDIMAKKVQEALESQEINKIQEDTKVIKSKEEGCEMYECNKLR